MRFELLVALRYLKSKQKERFISLISIISVAGVAVGVAALIVVLAVMSGFDEEIKEKIIGTYSHITITEGIELNNPDYVVSKVKGVEDVVSFSPFVSRKVILKSGENVEGILIRGVDPDREPTVANVKEFVGRGKLDFGKDGIILGSELRKNFNISLGDTVSLVSPEIGKTKDFVVRDTFTSGYYTYDANMAITSIESAKELFGEKCISGIGLKVKNEFNVNRVKKVLKERLGYPFVVRTWADLDRNLMRALAIEKKLMFVILAIVVIVACVNIASTLIMIVMEKTKDIGILKSIGATSRSIKLIFLMHGFMIAAIGVILGGVAGFIVTLRINNIANAVEKVTGFSLFPSDIYYLSEIPTKIVTADVFSIIIVAISVSIIASFYPAHRAARLDPIRAIRYE